MSTPNLSTILDFFNNQTVGAFAGAFLAFLLVAANDLRRERLKIKTLRAEIEVNRADALAKLETARRFRTMLLQLNQVVPAPVLRFNTAFSRQLAGEILHHLPLDHRRAIEALCYTMESIDEIFQESLVIARSFMGVVPHDRRIANAEHLSKNYADIVSNLKRFVEMSDWYLLGNFSKILTHQYDVDSYNEEELGHS